MAWTEERDAELRRLYITLGMTGTQVAKAMNITRNAVLGRAFRIGLTRADHNETALINNRRDRRKRARQLEVEREGARVVKLPKPPKLTVAPEPAPLPVTVVSKSLVNLGPSECHNPVGDGEGVDAMFCAAPTVPGRVYCLACMKLLYTPPTKRQQKALQRVAYL